MKTLKYIKIIINVRKYNILKYIIYMGFISGSQFILSLVIGSSLLGLLFRYCFKSKCNRVICCCLEIEREVSIELRGNEKDECNTSNFDNI